MDSDTYNDFCALTDMHCLCLQLPSLSFQSSCRFQEELNLNHHSNCWSGNSPATIFLFSLPSDGRSPSSHLRITPDFSLYIVWTQGGKKEGCISLIHKLLPPATMACKPFIRIRYLVWMKHTAYNSVGTLRDCLYNLCQYCGFYMSASTPTKDPCYRKCAGVACCLGQVKP